MANMRTLIRIVFVIFIANEIDCLGGVCNDFCDCLKEKEEKEKKEEKKKDDKNNDEEINKDEEIEKYEEIKEDKNITAKSLVNKDWYEAKEKNKENNLVLKIFKKKDNGISPSECNGDKFLIKLDKDNNPKIAYLQKKGDPLNLGGKKYALFEIKTKDENTVYLYCSDVESIRNSNGIFGNTKHVSISVIACDTKNIEKMNMMFDECKDLKKLEFGKNFNTENVRNMRCMFEMCSSLTELDLKNFNTKNVTNMEGMFCNCSNLKEINFGNNFNTSNVTNMGSMFYNCSSLGISEISEIKKKIDTTKVTNKAGMFYWHS